MGGGGGGAGSHSPPGSGPRSPPPLSKTPGTVSQCKMQKIPSQTGKISPQPHKLVCTFWFTCFGLKIFSRSPFFGRGLV